MSSARLEYELPSLHAGQQAVLRHPARFKVVIAGRQWGKTTLGGIADLETATEGQRAWWVAPSYKTADEGWEPIQGLVHQIPGSHIIKDERRAYLPGGGRVEVRSADQPDTLRGAKLKRLVLDEYCYMQERTWTYVLRPTLAVLRGTALFISSPNGTGTWGHRLFLYAQSAAGHQAGWQAWQFPTWTNPFITADEIESIRANTDATVFSQEYGAEWVDLSTLHPFKDDWIRYYRDEEVPPPLTLDVSIGVDPAISKRDTADYTALACVGSALSGPMQGYQFVLQAEKGHWSPYETVDHLFAWIRRWRPRRIVIEAVAYQKALADILTRESQVRGLPIPGLLTPRPELDKLRRALRLSPIVERGMLLFGPRQQEPLIQALLAVPANPREWDLVDALGLATTYGPSYRPAQEKVRQVDEATLKARLAIGSYAQSSRALGRVAPVTPLEPGRRARQTRKLIAGPKGAVTLMPGTRRSLPRRAAGYATRTRVSL